MPPDRIGSYRVTRVLGQGGMGVVYAAHDDRLDRPVAIKVVRPDVLADSAALTRFRREARAAARISHPHICPLYELGEHNEQPFLVMELLEGESLAARLERGARAGAGGPSPFGADARRSRGAASQRRHPSRPEAGQRVPDATRSQASRLRTRPTDRHRRHDQRGRAHRAGHDSRNAAVHVRRATLRADG